HVMWFVGCCSETGQSFNIPWYWTEAHPTNKNEDRARHLSFVVSDRESLSRLRASSVDKSRYMIVLRPSDPSLFRDNDFITEVANEATHHGMPIELEGSTLAHAYYHLTRSGCVVVARGEKEYSRLRKNIPLGKLVRDNIPGRIAARQEIGITATVPE